MAQNNKQYDCQECFRLVKPMEYHPYWYCVLHKAGQLDVAIKAITAYKDKAVEQALERLPLDCANCGVRTSFLEADLRKFNTGMCGACGEDALHTGFWAINAERNRLKGDN